MLKTCDTNVPNRPKLGKSLGRALLDLRKYFFISDGRVGKVTEIDANIHGGSKCNACCKKQFSGEVIDRPWQFCLGTNTNLEWYPTEYSESRPRSDVPQQQVYVKKPRSRKVRKPRFSKAGTLNGCCQSLSPVVHGYSNPLALAKQIHIEKITLSKHSHTSLKSSNRGIDQSLYNKPGDLNKVLVPTTTGLKDGSTKILNHRSHFLEVAKNIHLLAPTETYSHENIFENSIGLIEVGDNQKNVSSYYRNTGGYVGEGIPLAVKEVTRLALNINTDTLTEVHKERRHSLRLTRIKKRCRQKTKSRSSATWLLPEAVFRKPRKSASHPCIRRNGTSEIVSKVTCERDESAIKLILPKNSNIGCSYKIVPGNTLSPTNLYNHYTEKRVLDTQKKRWKPNTTPPLYYVNGYLKQKSIGEKSIQSRNVVHLPVEDLQTLRQQDVLLLQDLKEKGKHFSSSASDGLKIRIFHKYKPIHNHLKKNKLAKTERGGTLTENADVNSVHMESRPHNMKDGSEKRVETDDRHFNRMTTSGCKQGVSHKALLSDAYNLRSRRKESNESLDVTSCEVCPSLHSVVQFAGNKCDPNDLPQVCEDMTPRRAKQQKWIATTCGMFKGMREAVKVVDKHNDLSASIHAKKSPCNTAKSLKENMINRLLASRKQGNRFARKQLTEAARPKKSITKQTNETLYGLRDRPFSTGTCVGNSVFIANRTEGPSESLRCKNNEIYRRRFREIPYSTKNTTPSHISLEDKSHETIKSTLNKPRKVNCLSQSNSPDIPCQCQAAKETIKTKYSGSVYSHIHPAPDFKNIQEESLVDNTEAYSSPEIIQPSKLIYFRKEQTSGKASPDTNNFDPVCQRDLTDQEHAERWGTGTYRRKYFAGMSETHRASTIDKHTAALVRNKYVTAQNPHKNSQTVAVDNHDISSTVRKYAAASTGKYDSLADLDISIAETCAQQTSLSDVEQQEPTEYTNSRIRVEPSEAYPASAEPLVNQAQNDSSQNNKLTTVKLASTDVETKEEANAASELLSETKSLGNSQSKASYRLGSPKSRHPQIGKNVQLSECKNNLNNDKKPSTTENKKTTAYCKVMQPIPAHCKVMKPKRDVLPVKQDIMKSIDKRSTNKCPKVGRYQGESLKRANTFISTAQRVGVSKRKALPGSAKFEIAHRTCTVEERHKGSKVVQSATKDRVNCISEADKEWQNSLVENCAPTPEIVSSRNINGCKSPAQERRPVYFSEKPIMDTSEEPSLKITPCCSKMRNISLEIRLDEKDVTTEKDILAEPTSKSSGIGFCVKCNTSTPCKKRCLHMNHYVAGKVYPPGRTRSVGVNARVCGLPAKKTKVCDKLNYGHLKHIDTSKVAAIVPALSKEVSCSGREGVEDTPDENRQIRSAHMFPLKLDGDKRQMMENKDIVCAEGRSKTSDKLKVRRLRAIKATEARFTSCRSTTSGRSSASKIVNENTLPQPSGKHIQTYLKDVAIDDNFVATEDRRDALRETYGINRKPRSKFKTTKLIQSKIYLEGGGKRLVSDPCGIISYFIQPETATHQLATGASKRRTESNSVSSSISEDKESVHSLANEAVPVKLFSFDAFGETEVHKDKNPHFKEEEKYDLMSFVNTGFSLHVDRDATSGDDLTYITTPLQIENNYTQLPENLSKVFSCARISYGDQKTIPNNLETGNKLDNFVKFGSQQFMNQEHVDDRKDDEMWRNVSERTSEPELILDGESNSNITHDILSNLINQLTEPVNSVQFTQNSNQTSIMCCTDNESASQSNSYYGAYPSCFELNLTMRGEEIAENVLDPRIILSREEAESTCAPEKTEALQIPLTIACEKNMSHVFCVESTKGSTSNEGDYLTVQEPETEEVKCRLWNMKQSCSENSYTNTTENEGYGLQTKPVVSAASSKINNTLYVAPLSACSSSTWDHPGSITLAEDCFPVLTQSHDGNTSMNTHKIKKDETIFFGGGAEDQQLYKLSNATLPLGERNYKICLTKDTKTLPSISSQIGMDPATGLSSVPQGEINEWISGTSGDTPIIDNGSLGNVHTADQVEYVTNGYKKHLSPNVFYKEAVEVEKLNKFSMYTNSTTKVVSEVSESKILKTRQMEQTSSSCIFLEICLPVVSNKDTALFVSEKDRCETYQDTVHKRSSFIPTRAPHKTKCYEKLFENNEDSVGTSLKNGYNGIFRSNSIPMLRRSHIPTVTQTYPVALSSSVSILSMSIACPNLHHQLSGNEPIKTISDDKLYTTGSSGNPSGTARSVALNGSDVLDLFIADKNINNIRSCPTAVTELQFQPAIFTKQLIEEILDDVFKSSGPTPNGINHLNNDFSVSPLVSGGEVGKISQSFTSSNQSLRIGPSIRLSVENLNSQVHAHSDISHTPCRHVAIQPRTPSFVDARGWVEENPDTCLLLDFLKSEKVPENEAEQVDQDTESQGKGVSEEPNEPCDKDVSVENHTLIIFCEPQSRTTICGDDGRIAVLENSKTSPYGNEFDVQIKSYLNTFTHHQESYELVEDIKSVPENHGEDPCVLTAQVSTSYPSIDKISLRNQLCGLEYGPLNEDTQVNTKLKSRTPLKEVGSSMGQCDRQVTETLSSGFLNIRSSQFLDNTTDATTMEIKIGGDQQCFAMDREDKVSSTPCRPSYGDKSEEETKYQVSNNINEDSKTGLGDSLKDASEGINCAQEQSTECVAFKMKSFMAPFEVNLQVCEKHVASLDIQDKPKAETKIFIKRKGLWVPISLPVKDSRTGDINVSPTSHTSLFKLTYSSESSLVHLSTEHGDMSFRSSVGTASCLDPQFSNNTFLSGECCDQNVPEKAEESFLKPQAGNGTMCGSLSEDRLEGKRTPKHFPCFAIIENCKPHSSLRLDFSELSAASINEEIQRPTLAAGITTSRSSRGDNIKISSSEDHRTHYASVPRNVTVFGNQSVLFSYPRTVSSTTACSRELHKEDIAKKHFVNRSYHASTRWESIDAEASKTIEYTTSQSDTEGKAGYLEVGSFKPQSERTLSRTAENCSTLTDDVSSECSIYVRSDGQENSEDFELEVQDKERLSNDMIMSTNDKNNALQEVPTSTRVQGDSTSDYQHTDHALRNLVHCSVACHEDITDTPVSLSTQLQQIYPRELENDETSFNGQDLTNPKEMSTAVSSSVGSQKRAVGDSPVSHKQDKSTSGGSGGKTIKGSLKPAEHDTINGISGMSPAVHSRLSSAAITSANTVVPQSGMMSVPCTALSPSISINAIAISHPVSNNALTAFQCGSSSERRSSTLRGVSSKSINNTTSRSSSKLVRLQTDFVFERLPLPDIRSTDTFLSNQPVNDSTPVHTQCKMFSNEGSHTRGSMNSSSVSSHLPGGDQIRLVSQAGLFTKWGSSLSLSDNDETLSNQSAKDGLVTIFRAKLLSNRSSPLPFGMPSSIICRDRSRSGDPLHVSPLHLTPKHCSPMSRNDSTTATLSDLTVLDNSLVTVAESTLCLFRDKATQTFRRTALNPKRRIAKASKSQFKTPVKKGLRKRGNTRLKRPNAVDNSQGNGRHSNIRNGHWLLYNHDIGVRAASTTYKRMRTDVHHDRLVIGTRSWRNKRKDADEELHVYRKTSTMSMDITSSEYSSRGDFSNRTATDGSFDDVTSKSDFINSEQSWTEQTNSEPDNKVESCSFTTGINFCLSQKHKANDVCIENTKSLASARSFPWSSTTFKHNGPPAYKTVTLCTIEGTAAYLQSHEGIVASKCTGTQDRTTLMPTPCSTENRFMLSSTQHTTNSDSISNWACKDKRQAMEVYKDSDSDTDTGNVYFDQHSFQTQQEESSDNRIESFKTISSNQFNISSSEPCDYNYTSSSAQEVMNGCAQDSMNCYFQPWGQNCLNELPMKLVPLPLSNNTLSSTEDLSSHNFTSSTSSLEHFCRVKATETAKRTPTEPGSETQTIYSYLDNCTIHPRTAEALDRSMAGNIRVSDEYHCEWDSTRSEYSYTSPSTEYSIDTVSLHSQLEDWKLHLTKSVTNVEGKNRTLQQVVTPTWGQEDSDSDYKNNDCPLGSLAWCTLPNRDVITDLQASLFPEVEKSCTEKSTNVAAFFHVQDVNNKDLLSEEPSVRNIVRCVAGDHATGNKRSESYYNNGEWTVVQDGWVYLEEDKEEALLEDVLHVRECVLANQCPSLQGVREEMDGEVRAVIQYVRGLVPPSRMSIEEKLDIFRRSETVGDGLIQSDSVVAVYQADQNVSESIISGQLFVNPACFPESDQVRSTQPPDPDPQSLYVTQETRHSDNSSTTGERNLPQKGNDNAFMNGKRYFEENRGFYGSQHDHPSLIKEKMKNVRNDKSIGQHFESLFHAGKHNDRETEHYGSDTGCRWTFGSSIKNIKIPFSVERKPQANDDHKNKPHVESTDLYESQQQTFQRPSASITIPGKEFHRQLSMAEVVDKILEESDLLKVCVRAESEFPEFVQDKCLTVVHVPETPPFNQFKSNCGVTSRNCDAQQDQAEGAVCGKPECTEFGEYHSVGNLRNNRPSFMCQQPGLETVYEENDELNLVANEENKMTLETELSGWPTSGSCGFLECNFEIQHLTYGEGDTMSDHLHDYNSSNFCEYRNADPHDPVKQFTTSEISKALNNAETLNTNNVAEEIGLVERNQLTNRQVFQKLGTFSLKGLATAQSGTVSESVTPLVADTNQSCDRTMHPDPILSVGEQNQYTLPQDTTSNCNNLVPEDRHGQLGLGCTTLGTISPLNKQIDEDSSETSSNSGDATLNKEIETCESPVLQQRGYCDDFCDMHETTDQNMKYSESLITKQSSDSLVTLHPTGSSLEPEGLVSQKRKSSNTLAGRFRKYLVQRLQKRRTTTKDMPVINECAP